MPLFDLVDLGYGTYREYTDMRGAHMAYFFGESTHKARREHLCDFCCNWIQPGETYNRRMWVPHKGIFHAMKEHNTPGCPPNIGELHMQEIMRGERIALGVPIAFVLEAREYLLVQVDGSIVAKTEMKAVPVIGDATAIREQQSTVDYDEEIPF